MHLETQTLQFGLKRLLPNGGRQPLVTTLDTPQQLLRVGRLLHVIDRLSLPRLLQDGDIRAGHVEHRHVATEQVPKLIYHRNAVETRHAYVRDNDTYLALETRCLSHALMTRRSENHGVTVRLQKILNLSDRILLVIDQEDSLRPLELDQQVLALIVRHPRRDFSHPTASPIPPICPQPPTPRPARTPTPLDRQFWCR